MSALAGWQDGGFYRDTWQAEYSNFQVFSRPVQLHLRGIRRDHGYDATGLVTYPFFTDLQRYAWRVAGGQQRGPDPVPVAGPGNCVVRRPAATSSTLAAVARVGAPGHGLGIIGGEFSIEHGDPDDAGVFVTDSGLVPDTSSELRSRYQSLPVVAA